MPAAIEVFCWKSDTCSQFETQRIEADQSQHIIYSFPCPSLPQPQTRLVGLGYNLVPRAFSEVGSTSFYYGFDKATRCEIEGKIGRDAGYQEEFGRDGGIAVPICWTEIRHSIADTYIDPFITTICTIINTDCWVKPPGNGLPCRMA